MPFCIPPDTDWSCAYTAAELAAMREDPVTAARMDRSEILAWLTLARLTAYQIGVCPTTVRPCSAGCAPAGSWTVAPVGSGHAQALPSIMVGSWVPHINVAGNWTNSCACASRDACSCGALSEVILPGPVGEIVSVYQDGNLIPAESYRVDNFNRLVRLDGETWPSCQDMALSAEDGFSVTYYRGAAPNEMTRFAAGVLATEFYKACGGGKCRLPVGVTQVARDGVTYEIQTGMFAEGFTGIREVDAVIGIYNPYALKSAPLVYSPDMRRTRHTTGGRV